MQASVPKKIVSLKVNHIVLGSGVLNNGQVGFLINRSKTSNLLECVNCWNKDIDKSISADIMYFDFKKAFEHWE